MKKKILILPACLLLSIASSAQTVKDNISKQVKDSTAKREAGKADVYKMDNNIFDSTTFSKPANTTTAREKRTGKKKRHCKKG